MSRSLGELFLQLRHATEQFRQLLGGEDLAFHLPVWLGGIAKPFFAVWNVVHHAGLGGDGDLVADLQVAGQTDLPGQCDEIAELGAARNASLRDDETVFADGDVVGDLDEVIDLRAPANRSR